MQAGPEVANPRLRRVSLPPLCQGAGARLSDLVDAAAAEAASPKSSCCSPKKEKADREKTSSFSPEKKVLSTDHLNCLKMKSYWQQ